MEQPNWRRKQRLPRPRCWKEGVYCMVHFQGLNPTNPFFTFWASGFLQGQQYSLELVNSCLLVACCEWTPI